MIGVFMSCSAAFQSYAGQRIDNYDRLCANMQFQFRMSIASRGTQAAPIGKAVYFPLGKLLISLWESSLLSLQKAVYFPLRELLISLWESSLVSFGKTVYMCISLWESSLFPFCKTVYFPLGK